MTFTHPSILLLLGVPVILIVWAWQRRGFGLAMPFDHKEHRKHRVLGAAIPVFDMAPAIILAAAVIILAGPQVLRRPQDERVLKNIQFCVDVSGSMTSDNRYKMATEAITSFIDERPDDAFGMTLFGSYPIRWVPLTRDLDAIRNALPFADPSHQPSHMGGTEIGKALLFCEANMTAESDGGDRMIILVSDGSSGDLRDPAQVTEVVEALDYSGITLYHVHVAKQGVPVVVQDLARGSGGEAFVATDRKSLAKVFAHIDALEPDRFTRGGTVPMDWFRPFAVVGLIAIAMHFVGLFWMRYTPW
ncbi:MAG: VWA domain-containing protein [Phycisphaerales bacterium]|jgi:Ca-activated chloride channel family protein|nr:VWA domain-containing protein [Phycisphaerales bacterium]